MIGVVQTKQNIVENSKFVCLYFASKRWILFDKLKISPFVGFLLITKIVTGCIIAYSYEEKEINV